MIWFSIFCCWAISFLFAGIEAGLLAIDPVRLRHQAKEGRLAAISLERLLRRPEHLLVTVLLVTNLADIFALFLLTRWLVSKFGTPGFFIAGLLALPVYLFVLGVLPKSLFRRFPFRALAALAGILDLVTKFLWPLLELGERAGKLFLPPRAAESARLFAAREELKQITEQSEREGSITSAERVMIHNVVDFRAVKARDVMLPIANAVTISPQAELREILDLSASKNIERLPAVTENGEPAGLLNVLDLLLDKEQPPSPRKHIRRIVTAAEEEPAYRVLIRLRAARRGLAAIVDAKQKLIGVVALEDLIKRLIAAAPVSA